MASSIALVTKELGRVGLDKVLPARSTLPDTGAGLTPSVLERISGRPSGSVRSVQVLDEHHGTAGRIRLRLDATPEADLPETLFAKVTPHNLVQRLMMNIFELGAREVLFYDAVADEVPVRTPTCFGVERDPRRGRTVILLEDLTDGATFADIRTPATLEQAGAVVDALADLHATFWETPRFGTDLRLLAGRSAESEKLGNLFVGRILGNLKGYAADVLSPEVRRKGRIAFERRAEIDLLWLGLPQTLCHGDTHFGNLFFEGDVAGFLDWQAVMMSPSIRDVSYFLLASTDPTDLAPVERGLVDRYVTRLSAHGVEVDPDETWTLYRATAVEFYVAAVVTASTSDRMQPAEISQVGVDRVAAGMERLGTFDALEQLLVASAS